MKQKIALFVLSLFTLCSCEDVIQLDLKDGVEQLVVDAWLTNNAEEQVIKLTFSQPYFDNSTPKAVLGAKVIVFDEDSTAYRFVDKSNTGVYTFMPQNKNQQFNQLNKSYALYINYNGHEFYSLSKLYPVPKIDSLTYEFFEFPVKINDTIPQKGFIAQFYANDIVGQQNTYWIRFKKNSVLNIKPSLISISYDGGFSPNAESDGLPFIPPIRQSINDGLYQHGDSVEVDLYSITPEAFYFLFQVRQESSNAGIFATPPANIPTNIFNLNPTSTEKAIGFFSISSISTFKSKIDSTKALPKRNF